MSRLDQGKLTDEEHSLMNKIVAFMNVIRKKKLYAFSERVQKLGEYICTDFRVAS